MGDECKQLTSAAYLSCLSASDYQIFRTVLHGVPGLRGPQILELTGERALYSQTIINRLERQPTRGNCCPESPAPGQSYIPLSGSSLILPTRNAIERHGCMNNLGRTTCRSAPSLLAPHRLCAKSERARTRWKWCPRRALFMRQSMSSTSQQTSTAEQAPWLATLLLKALTLLQMFGSLLGVLPEA
jgi:hypothetical protein